MIKYLNEVIIEIDGKSYDINDTEEYKSFVIKLTDPINKFEKSNLKIDESVTDEQEKAICKNYKEFFEEFLANMNKIEKEVKEEFLKMEDKEI
ncbi:MAG: hypothetical protein GX752_08855 [Clostridium sp.]|nr:hypothetical protein [Clostridium sp.]